MATVSKSSLIVTDGGVTTVSQNAVSSNTVLYLPTITTSATEYISYITLNFTLGWTGVVGNAVSAIVKVNINGVVTTVATLAPPVSGAPAITSGSYTSAQIPPNCTVIISYESGSGIGQLQNLSITDSYVKFGNS